MRPGDGVSAGYEDEERLRNVADNLPGGMIYQVAADGDRRQFLYISAGVEPLFGLSPAEALADASSLYGMIEPEFGPALAAAEARALATGTPFKAEVAIRRADGVRRWVQISSAQRVRGDGRHVWDGIVLDVTDRKVAEAEREQSEKRLEIATNAAQIGIWEWNPQTNAVVYSHRAKEICGFALDQPLTFAQLRDVTHPDDYPSTSAAARRALDPAQRSREVYRYRVVRADTGEVRWVIAHGEASFGIVDGKEVAVSYIGTLIDITDQRRAELAVAASEARLRIAVEAAEMAVWELDPAAGEITQSPRLNRMYGFPADTHISLDDLRSCYAPGERERVEREGAEARARGETQIQLEYRINWPDGTEHWLLLRAAKAPEELGATDRVIGVVVDITDRKRAEERMELVARELQHRLKNSLAIVQTIANQSFRGLDSAANAVESFSGRLAALATATDKITANDWSDAYLDEVVAHILAPFRGDGADAFVLDGPSAPIPSRVAIGIAMALHELSTNAVKYGALSVPTGRVTLAWTHDSDGLLLTWRESGGPPVNVPSRKGFGTRMLERGVLSGAGSRADLEFRPDGLVFEMRVRL